MADPGSSMLSMPPDPSADESKHEVLFMDLAPYRMAMSKEMSSEQFNIFEQRYHEALKIYSSIKDRVRTFIVHKMPSEFSSEATLPDKLSYDTDENVIIPPRVYTPQEQQWRDMYVGTVQAIDEGVKHSEKPDATLSRDVAFMVLKSALHQYLTEHQNLTSAEWNTVNKALGPIFTSARAITGPLDTFRKIREPIQAECIAELNQSNLDRAQQLEDSITEFAHHVSQLDRLGSSENLKKQEIEYHDAVSNVTKAWFDPMKASPLGITTLEQAMDKVDYNNRDIRMPG